MFINRYRLWHDNTGKRPGWFLSRILVRDLNKQSKYYFIYDQWLAADKGDGQVIVFLFLGQLFLNYVEDAYSKKNAILWNNF